MNNLEDKEQKNSNTYELRKQYINEYKNGFRKNMTKAEFSAVMSAWIRIEDLAKPKPNALAEASLYYRVPKTVISRALKELPVVYTAFENTKSKMSNIFREIKIAEHNYQTKMEEQEPIKSLKAISNKEKEITYKYPVILNKVSLKEKMERPIKASTLEMFDKSIGRTRLSNIFYGVAGSVTYLEALEISRVTKLRFNEFIKEVLPDGNSSDDESSLKFGLAHELTYDELFPEAIQATLVKPQNQSEETQPTPIDIEQIEMWEDIKKSVNQSNFGVYEKRKLTDLISMKIESLKGNL